MKTQEKKRVFRVLCGLREGGIRIKVEAAFAIDLRREWVAHQCHFLKKAQASSALECLYSSRKFSLIAQARLVFTAIFRSHFLFLYNQENLPRA